MRKRWYWPVVRRRWAMHAHVVQIVDIAVGPVSGGFRTVVAWRWQCRLCGRVIVEATEAGMAEPESGWEWLDGEEAGDE